MSKQSLAQKSTYWLKVISLGLILGLGIQFARAWTSPDPNQPAPGGNVSGPITNGIVAQYKTGKLGVNSALTPTYALEVGGGGDAWIGGSVFAVGSINAMSSNLAGVLTSGKVQIVDVVTENTACPSNGLIAKDSVGAILSCQSGLWKKLSGVASPGGSPCPSVNMFSDMVSACGLPGGGAGYSPNPARTGNVAHGAVGGVAVTYTSYPTNCQGIPGYWETCTVMYLCTDGTYTRQSHGMTSGVIPNPDTSCLAG